jgi:DNA-binding NtrC family response regulator
MAAATEKRTRTVYVVDDERVIAFSLAAILNASGFRAVAFTDPTEAIRSAAMDAPDLMISDVIMPGMTGIELAIQFQSAHPGCKVLLFSGQAATADLLETASKQGHDFQILAKPIHPKDLLAAIAKL